MKDQTKTIKPAKFPFIFMGLLTFTLQSIGGGIVWLIYGGFAMDISLIVALVLAFVFYSFGFIWQLINRWVQANKEEYTIYKDKIVMKTGRLFSDQEIDLNLANVTKIDKVQPFVERFLFGTGRIAVETAGSGNSEVLMFAIRDLDGTLDQLIESVENSGVLISPKQEDLVLETQPVLIGVILDSIRWIFGLGFFIFATFTFFSDLLVQAIDFLGRGTFWTLFIVVLLFITLVGVLGIILHYFDLKNRLYSVYKNSIRYYEGFLTKHEYLIPLQNLTDSEKTQSLFQKIFSIYSIKISTKGSANNLFFNNLKNGEDFETKLDELIDIAKDSKSSTVNAKINKTDKSGKSESGESISSNNENKHSNLQERHVGDNYKKEFRFNLARLITTTIVQSLIIPAILFVVAIILFIFSQPEAIFLLIIGGLVTIVSLLFAAINIAIKYYSTKFLINENSIKFSFNFLSKRNQDFSMDRITYFESVRGILDRFVFNTVNYKFVSIGSPRPINFSNIKHDQSEFNKIKSKFDYKGGKPVMSFNPEFNFSSWVSPNLSNWVALLFFTLLFGFLAIVISMSTDNFIGILLFIIGLIAVFIISILSFVYLRVFYGTVEVNVFEKYVEYKGGLIFWREVYVPLEYVKDIETIKYPFINIGELKLNVAGDLISSAQQEQTQPWESSQSWNYQQSYTYGSLKLQVKYLSAIDKIDDRVDSYLLDYQDNMNLDTKVIKKTKPSIANYLVQNIPLILIPILWPVLALNLYVFLKREYIIETDRIVYKSGWFYQRQFSILYKQIDFIDKGTGLLNKIFGNGSIQINTEGSSSVELVILDIPDYNEVKELITEKYSQFR